MIVTCHVTGLCHSQIGLVPDVTGQAFPVWELKVSTRERTNQHAWGGDGDRNSPQSDADTPSVLTGNIVELWTLVSCLDAMVYCLLYFHTLLNENDQLAKFIAFNPLPCRHRQRNDAPSKSNGRGRGDGPPM